METTDRTGETSDRSDWVRDALARWEAPLVRYAAGLLRDPHRARDVVQDTFLRLCRADRRQVEDHLGKWLFTVCRNRATDVLRKEGRMTPLNGTTVEALALERAPRRAAPDAEVERRDTADTVLAAVDRLPERQADVVRLRFQAGLSYREIARVTGHSVGNVGYLLHHAMRTLRSRLREVSPVESYDVARPATGMGEAR